MEPDRLLRMVANYPFEVEGLDTSKKENFDLLFKRQRATGDKGLRERLVLPHLRFVIQKARKFARIYKVRHLDAGDLTTAGYFGLERAYDGYDPDRGYHFLTYASWWVWQKITREIYDNEDEIRVPEYARKDISFAMISLDDSYNVNGRPLSDDIEDEGSRVPFDGVEELSLDEIFGIVKSLTEREKNILRLRLEFNGLGKKTFREVGLEYNLSYERIRQLEASALKKIRTGLAKDGVTGS